MGRTDPYVKVIYMNVDEMASVLLVLSNRFSSLHAIWCDWHSRPVIAVAQIWAMQMQHANVELEKGPRIQGFKGSRIKTKERQTVDIWMVLSRLRQTCRSGGGRWFELDAHEL